MSYSALRQPHTTQEKRMWFASLDEAGCNLSRARRSPRNLADAWDDIGRSSHNCWKQHRKTQYRVKDAFSRRKKDSSIYGESMSRRDHWHLEHYRCEYKRCKSCIKSGIWNDYDKQFARRMKKKEPLIVEYYWNFLNGLVV